MTWGHGSSQSFLYQPGGGGLVVKLCLILVIPWTIACQALLFMGFCRQEYWSELPYPSPGESSQPRDRTQVSCTAGGFFTI